MKEKHRLTKRMAIPTKWTKSFALDGHPVYERGEWLIFQKYECVEVYRDSGWVECYGTLAEAKEAVKQIVQEEVEAERQRLEALAILDALAKL